MNDHRDPTRPIVLDGIRSYFTNALKEKIAQIEKALAPKIASGPVLMVPDGVGPGSTAVDPGGVDRWVSVCLTPVGEFKGVGQHLVDVLDALGSRDVPVSFELLSSGGSGKWLVSVPASCVDDVSRVLAGCFSLVQVTTAGVDDLRGAVGDRGVQWLIDVVRPGLDLESLLSEVDEVEGDLSIVWRLLSQVAASDVLVGVQVVMVPLVDGWHSWLSTAIDVDFLARVENTGSRLVVPSSWQGGVSPRALDRVGGRARRFWSVTVRGFSTGLECPDVTALGCWLTRSVIDGRSCVAYRETDWVAVGVDVTAAVVGRWSPHVGCLVHSGELARLIPLPGVGALVGAGGVVGGVDIGDGFRVGVGLMSGSRVTVPAGLACAGGVHVLGSTGCGKSTLLELLVGESVRALASGGVVIDLHGDLAIRCAELLSGCGSRVWCFDPTRGDVPGLNFLTPEAGVEASWWVDGLVMAFRGLYMESWGARLEHILRSVLLSLVHTGKGCVSDALEVLGRGPRGDAWRRSLVSKLPPDLVRFWRSDFPSYRRGELDSTINRLSRLVLMDGVGTWFSSRVCKWSWSRISNAGEWAVFRLPVGRLGSGVASTVASLIALVAGQSVMGREGTSNEEARHVVLVMDEFQRLSSDAVRFVCEGRKFGLIPILAHQSMGQVSAEVSSMLGVAGVTVVFRPSAGDLKWCQTALFDQVSTGVLARLGVGECAVRSGGMVQLVRVDKPQKRVGVSWDELAVRTGVEFGVGAGVESEVVKAEVEVPVPCRRRVYDDI